MGFRRLAAALAVLGAVSGCGGVIDPSKNITENFSATLAPGGSGPSHVFSASKNGEYTVRLTALSPPTGTILSLVFAQQISGQCSLITTVPAILNRDALSGGIDKGSYCLILVDPGSLSQTETYTLTVSHP